MGNNMEQQNNNPAQNSNMDDDEISLIELATILGEEKKILFGLPIAAGIVAVVVSLLMTPIFTATTTLLPPQTSQGGAAALLGQLGGLGGLAGLDIGGGAGSPEMFVTMLQSRSAKDKMIERFNLMEKYEAEFKTDVYKKLDKVVEITTDKKSGLITVAVDDEEPQFAADMANAYYEVLKELLTRVAITEAQQKRVFFEEQFAKAKNELADAEVKLKEVQERTGLIQLEGQATATFEAIAQLRAEVTRREAQLAALRSFATTSNPEYRRVSSELASLRAQLAETEKTSGANSEDLTAFSTGKLPEQGLEYVRAFREVRYNEAIFEIMAKQFELAKVEEAKETSNIQQLDQATVPEKRSSPKRGIIVIGALFLVSLLSILAIYARALWRKSKAIRTNSRIKYQTTTT